MRPPRRNALLAGFLSLVAGPTLASDTQTLSFQPPDQSVVVPVVDLNLAFNPTNNRLVISGVAELDEDGVIYHQLFQAGLSPSFPTAGPDTDDPIFDVDSAVYFDRLLAHQRAALANTLANPHDGNVYTAATILDFNTAPGSLVSVFASDPDATLNSRDNFPSGSGDFLLNPVLHLKPGSAPDPAQINLIAIADSFFTAGFALDRYEVELDELPSNRTALLPGLSTGLPTVDTSGASNTTRSLAITTDGDDIVGVFTDASGANPQPVSVLDTSEQTLTNFRSFEVASTAQDHFILAVLADQAGPGGTTPGCYLARIDPTTGLSGAFSQCSANPITSELSLATSSDGRLGAVVTQNGDGGQASIFGADGVKRTSTQLIQFPLSSFQVSNVDAVVTDDGRVIVGGTDPDGNVVLGSLSPVDVEKINQPGLVHWESFLSPILSPDITTFTTDLTSATLVPTRTQANNFELELFSADGSPVSFLSSITNSLPSEFADPDFIPAVEASISVCIKADQDFIDGDAKVEVQWTLQSVDGLVTLFDAVLVVTSDDFAGADSYDKFEFDQNFLETVSEGEQALYQQLLDDGQAQSFITVSMSAADDPTVWVDDIFVTFQVVPEPGTGVLLALVGLGVFGHRRVRAMS